MSETGGHGQIRLLTSTDAELLESRINAFLAGLPPNAAVIDIKIAAEGTMLVALIHYKELQANW
jgi:hypothetical protein